MTNILTPDLSSVSGTVCSNNLKITVRDERVDVFWMIPISEAEFRFVLDHGPEAFDDLLAEEDPDLIDPTRPSLLV